MPLQPSLRKTIRPTLNETGCCRSSERFANRETESRLGLKVVQAPGIVHQRFKLRANLQRIDRWIDAIEGMLEIGDVFRLDEWRRRNDLRVQAIEIVGVVDAEGRLHDGKLHAELNAGGAAHAEIGAAGDAQLVDQTGAGELRGAAG